MDSLWLNTVKNTHKYSSLTDNINVDVCVIGAGIFGITCAYYLSKLGFNVCVLEKNDVGSKTTGHTTGKITSQHGLFYDYLVNSYSEKFASDYLKVNEMAIKNIKKIIDDESINCDFEYQNNYVYTTSKSELRAIKKEISALESIGFPCEFVTKTGLPFKIEGAVCFKNQAQFNPLKYLFGLCDCITSNLGKIYTHTTATNVEKDFDGSYVVSTDNYFVKSIKLLY